MTGTAQPGPSLSMMEMARLRDAGRAVVLLDDAASPMLLDGQWWAIQATDRNQVYQPVDGPTAAQLAGMARRLAAATAAVTALDSPRHRRRGDRQMP